MAEVLPEGSVEFYTNATVDPLPWGEWLNGQIWKLMIGSDLPAGWNRQKVYNMVKYQARTRGVAVRIRTMGAEVFIQAYEP